MARDRMTAKRLEVTLRRTASICMPEWGEGCYVDNYPIYGGAKLCRSDHTNIYPWGNGRKSLRELDEFLAGVWVGTRKVS